MSDQKENPLRNRENIESVRQKLLAIIENLGEYSAVDLMSEFFNYDSEGFSAEDIFDETVIISLLKHNEANLAYENLNEKKILSSDNILNAIIDHDPYFIFSIGPAAPLSVRNKVTTTKEFALRLIRKNKKFLEKLSPELQKDSDILAEVKK